MPAARQREDLTNPTGTFIGQIGEEGCIDRLTPC